MSKTVLRSGTLLSSILWACSFSPASAQAETALYELSLILHAFSGGTPLPIGGAAEASGTLEFSATGSGPAPIALPGSVLGVDTAAYWPIFPPTTFYSTYARFANGAGNFFAGGGPAAGKGTVSHKGKSNRTGSWFIREGENGFGGTLGLLGVQGAFAQFKIRAGGACGPRSGVFKGTSSWNMIRALGRNPTDSLNPYTNTGMFVNRTCGLSSPTSIVITYTKFGSGTAWTTGTVTVVATQGDYSTSLRRSGYDTTTSGGVRNIQLVTPALTHWAQNHASTFDHTGHIGILKLHLIPEPTGLGVLAVGAHVLLLLYRRRHSSSSGRDLAA